MNSIYPARVVKMIVGFLTLLLPIVAFVYNTQLNDYAGCFLYAGQYYGIFLCIVLLLIYLTIPAHKNMKPFRWYDMILAGISLFVCFYFVFTYEQKIVIEGAMRITQLDIYVAIFTVIVVFEALRRTMGYGMFLLGLFFLIYASSANYFPGILYGPAVPFQKSIIQMYLSTDGVFGKLMGIGATYIIAFTTLAGFLIALGSGQKFTDLALALVGRVRGGAAKVAVVGSALFSTISGSPTANVGLTGSFSIPLMKRLGFSPEFAAAVETTASIGGTITPPIMGVLVFVAVELTNIPYYDWIKAAILPAALFYLAIYIQIDLYSARNMVGVVPASEMPDKRKAIINSMPVLFVIGMFVYLIAVLKMEPVLSVYISIVVLILLSFFDKDNRISFEKVYKALDECTNSCIKIIPLMAVAGIILVSISTTGTGLRLTYRLLDIAGDSLLVLTILTALICYVLGMGVSSMISYVILATLIAPSLVEFGIPVIVAHFFIIYMMLTEFFTPPVALVAAVASSMAKSKFYPTCWEAMKLSILVYLIPIGIIFSPALLFEDTTVINYIFRIIISVVSIYAISVGFQGFFLKRITAWERVLWSIGGILVFFPKTMLFIAGLIIIMIAIIIYFINPENRLTKKAVL